MNLREGRIGRQETLALALLSCAICGIFSANPALLYRDGNSAYLSSALSAALALLLFLLVAEAMRRKNCRNLAALYRVAFGRVLSVPMALITLLALLLSAAEPLARLCDMLSRYVYTESPVQTMMLYVLPCVLFLAWKGLETLGRTVRLLTPLVLLSVLIAFVVAIPAYEPRRLYPLLGNGLFSALRIGVTGVGRFAAPLLCLLICGVGVQGVDNAAFGGGMGTLFGGLLTSGAQLCLGMTFPYELLRTLTVPMYRLTMAVHTGSTYLRLDKLLLFLWALGSFMIAGFYTYAAGLLFTSASSMRDVRPAALAASASLCAGTLVMLLLPDLAQWLSAINTSFLFIALLLPPLLAAALACVKKGGDA